MSTKYRDLTNRKKKAKEIIKKLSSVYPQPKTALHFSNPLELLIATILSAQTTDKVVNTVTPALFVRYKTAKDYAKASVEDLAVMINKVNFYRNKAKNIRESAKIISEKYGGVVPETMGELDSLPGVARKTANVVMSGAFGKTEGITVDTHVMRLSKRLGLTANSDPVKIEQDLMRIVPKEHWRDFPHLLILHGRDKCPARPHKCLDCPLDNLCPDTK